MGGDGGKGKGGKGGSILAAAMSSFDDAGGPPPPMAGGKGGGMGGGKGGGFGKGGMGGGRGGKGKGDDGGKGKGKGDSFVAHPPPPPPPPPPPLTHDPSPIDVIFPSRPSPKLYVSTQGHKHRPAGLRYYKDFGARDSVHCAFTVWAPGKRARPSDSEAPVPPSLVHLRPWRVVTEGDETSAAEAQAACANPRFRIARVTRWRRVCATVSR